MTTTVWMMAEVEHDTVTGHGCAQTAKALAEDALFAYIEKTQQTAKDAGIKFRRPLAPAIAFVGNLSKGFEAYGPYDEFDEAAFIHGGEEGWIMELRDTLDPED